MTEEQAKTKWCPQVRFNGDACNRGEADMATPNPRCKSIWNNCIASDCMMWTTTMLQRFDEELQCNVIDLKDGRCGLAK